MKRKLQGERGGGGGGGWLKDVLRCFCKITSKFESGEFSVILIFDSDLWFLSLVLIFGSDL